MNENKTDIKITIISTALSFLGCVIGYYICIALTKSGFYSLMFVGLGAGLLGGFFQRQKSLQMGIICSVISVLGSLLTEALVFPFKADHSISYFISNIHQINYITWLMVIAGAYIAYRLGSGYRIKREEPEE